MTVAKPFVPRVGDVRAVVDVIKQGHGYQSAEAFATAILAELHERERSRKRYVAGVDVPGLPVLLVGRCDTELEAARQAARLRSELTGDKIKAAECKTMVFTLYPPSMDLAEILHSSCQTCGVATVPGLGRSVCGCQAVPVVMDDGSVELDYERRCAVHGDQSEPTE